MATSKRAGKALEFSGGLTQLQVLYIHWLPFPTKTLSASGVLEPCNSCRRKFISLGNASLERYVGKSQGPQNYFCLLTLVYTYMDLLIFSDVVTILVESYIFTFT